MKQNNLPTELRDCPHCKKTNRLSFYHEQFVEDLYYCTDCFGLVAWNGEMKRPIGGEAYPMRDKGKRKI